jgi:hypothetical protein
MPQFPNPDNTIGRPAARPETARRFDLSDMRPIDLYDAWLFAEADATLALAAWRTAARPDKGDAHAAFIAALDREAHAAALLERRIRGHRVQLRP